ncbi:hypothetical protein [Sphaerisporangium aureirubrum]|uniref:Uncharacterized protein n=1 Tax=Sphaerisporangium aureirubrum TaxID=1544736 RepID=A0ABW1NFV2_9ACTN
MSTDPSTQHDPAPRTTVSWRGGPKLDPLGEREFWDGQADYDG